jgi:hypothetical protein
MIEMIGKCFQFGGCDVYYPGIDEDQARYSADKATGKEKSLKEGSPGS